MKPRYIDQFTPAALDEALQPYRGQALSMLLAEPHLDDIAQLQQHCSRLDIRLDGAIFPQLLYQQKWLAKGAWLLPRKPDYLSTLLHLPAEQSADTLANLICEQLAPILESWPDPAAPPTLFLTFDATISHIASILEGIYLRLADRVHYAGVNAGSGQFRPIPCLFNNHEQIQHGVLCALLPHHSYPFLDHGYQLMAHPMLATSSEHNKVTSIDWEPAFQKYQALIQQHKQHPLTEAQFYESGVHFPLGLLRANGDVLVRVPVDITKDGALLCVGEIPDHSILTLLQAPASPTEHSRQLAERLQQFYQLDAHATLEVFYCAGRQLHFGSDSELELQTLLEYSRAGELVGALSLGEIGHLQSGDYPLFHNGAILCNGTLYQ